MSEASYVTTSGGQQVLILREGATQSRGKRAQNNNISAAKLIAEIVRTSLWPMCMDKMLVDSMGDVTITNDGATMLKEIDVQHPAAKMMVEISKATDNEVGDGTKTGVILAGALLEKADPTSRADLIKVATTSMQTKLVTDDAPFLAGLVVDAVSQVAEKSGDGY